MRIATYNIWNSDVGMPMRFQQLIGEITEAGADILCLQEVADSEKHNAFSSLCGYDYSCWQAQTGLSILSRYSIDKSTDFEYATSAYIFGGENAACCQCSSAMGKSIFKGKGDCEDC